MKNYFNILTGKLLTLSACTTLIFAATSCESVYDGEGDCDPRYYVKFVFDMNMEFADAFNEQVQSVDLWIFDKATGQLVNHIADSGEALAKEGYKLPIDIKPGEYRIVSWCGLEGNRHFNVNSNITSVSDPTVKMVREYAETGAVSDQNLDELFHGIIDISVPDWNDIQDVMYKGGDMPKQTEVFGTRTVYEPEYRWDEVKQQYDITFVVSLIRDTNNITLTLEHLSGQFNLDQLCIEMVDNNGTMYHDNELNEGDEMITYYPWRTATGTLDQGELSSKEYDINDPGNKDNRYADFVTTEISTARMTTDHEKVIRIWYKDTKQTVFQLPVTRWATQLRSAKNYKDPSGRPISDQEYLDRENQYDLIVFLQDDGRGGWVAVQVVINGWHIIENGQEVL